MSTPDPTTTTTASKLLNPWSGPFGGLPPFDQVDVAAFQTDIDHAMSLNLAEIDTITASQDPPTFDNTISAMENSGRVLDRVLTVFGVWCSNMSTAAVQEVERAVAPRLAAFSDRITQNDALFQRIEAVYNADRQNQTTEQQRLVWLYHTDFVRAGARLGAAAKARLSEINQRLAALFTEFNQNILADESAVMLVLDDDAGLAGLPQSLRDGAAALATARGLTGKWVIGNTRSFMEPFLTYSDRRDLRERGWRMWVNRGDNGDEHDNKANVREILQLRAERARLLGYETHAHWRLETAMARTPQRALQLLEDVWTPAVARVLEEVADMQHLADEEGAGIAIAPWDYRHYAEKVRKSRYDLDQNDVKPYLQLEQLREAMFWVAGELLDFAFDAVMDVPVYHPDVRVWRVTDRATDRHVGLWYFDPYAREGKRSGAWMSAYRSQERFAGDVTTMVSNNCNFVRSPAGEPALISWDDAVTLFHEFGHALHGLSSNVEYPSLSGTAVPRDYVEFPSQLLEHWLPTAEVLQRFAVHYRTQEPIPDGLVKRIERASTFNQGFATTEYLASALIDMKLHLAGESPIDVAAFERDALAAMNTPHEIVMRHRTPSFQHVFGSDGYSAGYYSYLWADVLVADAFEAFNEEGGPYDAGVAARLRDHIFARGNTIDPADAYRAFRGRDPGIAALLRKRGFV